MRLLLRFPVVVASSQALCRRAMQSTESARDSVARARYLRSLSRRTREIRLNGLEICRRRLWVYDARPGLAREDQ